jgi:hypothetical protein
MSLMLHRIEYLAYYALAGLALLANIATLFHDSLHLF